MGTGGRKAVTLDASGKRDSRRDGILKEQA